VDIVPVALVGTYELLPDGYVSIKCRPLEMRVGENDLDGGTEAERSGTLSADGGRRQWRTLY